MRKDTKADRGSPDMEAEILALAPDFTDRLHLHAAHCSAILRLLRLREKKA